MGGPGLMGPLFGAFALPVYRATQIDLARWGRDAVSGVPIDPIEADADDWITPRCHVLD
jgi:hypothetical protein